jgi:hypothetical protein
MYGFLCVRLGTLVFDYPFTSEEVTKCHTTYYIQVGNYLVVK